jgi:DNA polymerase-3 subunit alpha/error-prone DNA polymerase
LYPITHRGGKEYELHKVLRAIDRNILLSLLPENDCCKQWERLIAGERLVAVYKDYPQIVENTEQLLNECSFDFDFKSPKNKKNYTNSKEEDKILLATLARAGLEMRYGKDNQEAEQRMIRELEVIDKLSFSAYFLITWDIIQYSMKQGYYHVGRGSGANSIVAYCLGITDICPLELNLYFERFLNSGRTSPPDFDIDWSWKNRDEILTYIFNRFGHAVTGFCEIVNARCCINIGKHQCFQTQVFCLCYQFIYGNSPIA